MGNERKAIIDEFIINHLQGHNEPTSTDKCFLVPNNLLIAAIKVLGDPKRDYYLAILKEKSDRVAMAWTRALTFLNVILVMFTAVLIWLTVILLHKT